MALTWRNVAGPDLSAAANMMQRATQNWGQAFDGFSNTAEGMFTDLQTNASQEAMAAAQRIQSSDEWQKALQSGTALGGFDPRYINRETMQWADQRGSALLRDDQVRQSMELARKADARAAQAASLRASGGSRGGSGGSGGGRSGSNNLSFQLALAEGKRREVIAQYGEGSPEALKASRDLQTLSAAEGNVTGFLNGSDGASEYFKATKAAEEERISADAAVLLQGVSDENGIDIYGQSPLLSQNTPPASIQVKPEVQSRFAGLSFGSDASASAAPVQGGFSFGQAVDEVAPQTAVMEAMPESDRPRTFGEYARNAMANMPAAEPDVPLTPRDAQMQFDLASDTIQKIQTANPTFAIESRTNELRGIEGGLSAIVEEISKNTDLSEEGKASLGTSIQEIARDSGVSLQEAAAAISYSTRPENFSSGLFGGNTYFNEREVKNLLAQRKAENENPRGAIYQNSGFRAARDELSTVRKAYESNRRAMLNVAARVQAGSKDKKDLDALARYQQREAELAPQIRSLDQKLMETAREAGLMIPEAPQTVEAPLGSNIMASAQDEGEQGQDRLDPVTARRLAVNVETYGTPSGLTGFYANRETFQGGSVDPTSEGGQKIAAAYLPSMVQSGTSTEAKEGFFSWAAQSPEVLSEIFTKIQAAEYNGDSVDIPQSVMERFEEFKETRVPAEAVTDLSNLGFDLRNDPDTAVSVLNDPTVQAKLRIWKTTQGFFTLDSTKEFNTRQVRQAIGNAIRAKKRNTEE